MAQVNRFNVAFRSLTSARASPTSEVFLEDSFSTTTIRSRFSWTVFFKLSTSQPIRSIVGGVSRESMTYPV
jgi:hypothetical protein